MNTFWSIIDEGTDLTQYWTSLKHQQQDCWIFIYTIVLVNLRIEDSVSVRLIIRNGYSAMYIEQYGSPATPFQKP